MVKNQTAAYFEMYLTFIGFKNNYVYMIYLKPLTVHFLDFIFGINIKYRVLSSGRH